MPKRSAPPASTSAFPSGTAFRKSASKKRKGDSEPVKVDVSSTKTDSQKVNGAANKGKGKAKQTTPAANLPKTATKNANSIPQYDGKDVQAALHRTAAINAATNGKKKETARFKEPSLKEASTSKPKSKASEEDKAMFQPSKKDLGPPSSFRIVVGSYERLLYGFHVTFQNDGAQRSASFETMFSFAAHTSCISAIAAAGADSKWLATGAGDETVRVWDLKKKKEVGGLVGHNGTIHSLSFPARTYLLSADSSGLINLYRTRDWSLLKTLRGHTGQVNACVAHPSGRLALSVGKDGMLRMWDLMRGKGAGAVRLNLGQEEGGKVLFKEEPLDVKWNSSGTRFAVMGRTEVVVYKTDMSRIAGLLVRRDDPKRRFGCVEWQGDDVLLTGNEMGVVEVYKVNDQSLEGPVGKLLGHTNR
jgi:protein MAK11